LEERGFGVVSTDSAESGERLARELAPVAVILVVRLPDRSGLELVEALRRTTQAPVLMITAFHDMATTILAMKAGAFDYIQKPIDIRALDVALDRALEVRRLSRGTDFFSVEAQRAVKLGDIVGASPPMQRLFKDVGR